MGEHFVFHGTKTGVKEILGSNAYLVALFAGSGILRKIIKCHKYVNFRARKR